MEVIAVSKPTREYTDYPLHTHGSWEILFSLKGTGEIRLENDILPFHEGTVFVIPPNVPHCKRAKDGFADGCIFANNISMPDDKVHVFEDDSKHVLTTLFDMAYTAQNIGGPNTKKIVDALGDTIYQMLIAMSERKSKLSEAVDQFVHLLIDNISNSEFNIGKAIEDSGYNPNYFRKLFKETMNVSPVEYMTRLKIEHAKREIKQYGNIRQIKEIAERAGFEDPYYFSRKFKQYTGMSPRDYLKSMEDSDSEMLFRTVIAEDDDPEKRARRVLRQQE